MRSFKAFLAIFILTSLFSVSICHAGSASRENKLIKDKISENAIHTYGGGDLLENIFNSIAMLIYGNTKTGIGKTFMGILRIGLAIGGFSCICLAFFREKFEPLIKNFFLPAVGIICCLLVPRTTVFIQDHLMQKAVSSEVWGLKKVENVPFFLGKFASLVSTVSYHFTRALEGVAHGVNDKMYNWTGHIYAGENIFLTRKWRIANQVLEDDFREFCRECIFRDIGIGLYSKDELVNTPNILKFLEENTSSIRTVLYRDPQQNETTSLESGFIPCKEAMRRMNCLFNNQVGNTKEVIFGELGNETQFLIGQKDAGEKELKNLIKQHISINILKEEIPGSLNSFAAKRAEILQRENQKILGALGANSIVAMRNFFEAITYMVFPLILIVALLSFGIQPLIHWTHFILWVNTWPIFYVVVNFLLNSTWNFRKKLLWGDSLNLTVFTSDGLADLYSSMESIAAIAMATIPYLSWILLKGGVSQMVQLASSIMSPAQTAASTAAAEKTSGNYSFGNINLESLSGHNAQMFRQSYNGMLSYGSVGIDTGSETLSYVPGRDGLFIKQGDSYLREGISRTQAFSQSLQNSLSASESAVLESSKAISSGITDTANKGVGLVQAISRHLQHGENFNIQEMTGTQKAFQNIKSLTEEYAHSQGVSTDTAVRELLSTGIGAGIYGLKGETQASFKDGVSKFNSDVNSEKTSLSSSFQDQIQTIKNVSKGEVASLLGSEDAKLHQDFVQSLSQTESSVDQWRAAYSRQEGLTKVKNYAESSQLQEHQNLNQRFVEFLQDKFHGDVGKVSDTIELNNSNSQKRALIDEFVRDYLPETIASPSFSDIHETNASKLGQVSGENFEKRKSDFFEEMQPKIGHGFGEIEGKIERMQSQIDKGTTHDLMVLNHKKGEEVTMKSFILEENAKKNIEGSFGKYAKKQMMNPLPGYGMLIYEKLFKESKTGEKNDRN